MRSLETDSDVHQSVFSLFHCKCAAVGNSRLAARNNAASIFSFGQISCIDEAQLPVSRGTALLFVATAFYAPPPKNMLIISVAKFGQDL